jgi:hypothetical protein
MAKVTVAQQVGVCPVQSVGCLHAITSSAGHVLEQVAVIDATFAQQR